MGIGNDIGLVITNDPCIDDCRSDRQIGRAGKHGILSTKVHECLLVFAGCIKPDDTRNASTIGVETACKRSSRSLSKRTGKADARQIGVVDIERKLIAHSEYHIRGKRAVIGIAGGGEAIPIGSPCDIRT